MRKPYRIYADTSIFGGCFDPPWQEASRGLLDSIDGKNRLLVVSAVTLLELRAAPMHVQEVFDRIDTNAIQVVGPDPEIDILADRLLEGGAIPPGSRADALHVAAAIVREADVLVSWNFRHLVNVERIRKVHGIILGEGYRPIEIRSPWEVISDG